MPDVAPVATTVFAMVDMVAIVGVQRYGEVLSVSFVFEQRRGASIFIKQAAGDRR